MCCISICGSGTTREEKLTFGYLVILVSEKKMDTRMGLEINVQTFQKNLRLFDIGA